MRIKQLPKEKLKELDKHFKAFSKDNFLDAWGENDLDHAVNVFNKFKDASSAHNEIYEILVFEKNRRI